MSEKTEEPTPRKLRKAREQGDSPISAALVQSLAFVAALALAPAAIGAVAARAGSLLTATLQKQAEPLSAAAMAMEVVMLSAPLLFAGALAAAAVGFVQTGGIVATQKLAPDLSRANPVTGVANLFTRQRLISLVRALLGALVVGWLALRLLEASVGDLARSVGNLNGAIALAADRVERLGWIAALVGIALAAVDLLVSYQAWRLRHKMTKDEIKREYKESEGDPELKAARKRQHQELLAGSMIAAVKQATVLIVNPTHYATALHYQEDEDQAPRVVAQGQGELARHMIDAARAYGVPVIRDVPVARALAELELGDEIPEELYEAVAEILREAWTESERSAGEP